LVFKKREPERPRNVELWVSSMENGRYMAIRMRGVYQVDIDKEVKKLERYLKSRWPHDYRVSVKETG